MTVTAAHEAPRPGSSLGFSDAVTFSFGAADANIYGVARLGLSTGPDGEPTASGLGVMFAAGEPVAVRAAGGVAASRSGWEGVEVAGVSTEVLEPLRAWRMAFVDDSGGTGFELEFHACGPPAELAADSAAARSGGMEGYEQLCRVTGTARVRDDVRPITCLGQRGHTWGAPDWDRIVLARTVSAWIDDGPGVTVTAIRDKKARGHGDEAMAAFLFEPEAEDGEHVPQVIADPRLSTITDGEGRQRRSGLELYRDDEDDEGRRLAGDVVCGTSLDLGRLRLDCAFFVWHMEGKTGVGRYDVVRRP